MVINIGALKSRDDPLVTRDIRGVSRSPDTDIHHTRLINRTRHGDEIGRASWNVRVFVELEIGARE